MTEKELIEGLWVDPTRRVRTIPPEDTFYPFAPEAGIVLNSAAPIENGMLNIEVDERFRDGETDDLLRELSADQVEWE